MSVMVDLSREFLPPPTSDELDPDWEIAIARAAGKARSWDDLHGRAIVILGEGGTGKSCELKMRCLLLRDRGEHAFVVRLANLRVVGLNRALGLDWDAFRTWHASDAPCTVFLDELDEAKLAHATVEEILRDLESELGSAASRVRIVLSCRPSAWNTQIEGAAIRRAFHRWGTPTDASEQELEVVSLAPLDLHRAKTLAKHWGVENVEEFGTAIDENGLTMFVERPLDVEWLVPWWKEKRQLGSLTDMIEASLRQKILDRRAGPPLTDLAFERARAGAEELAAIATLSAERSFLIPGAGSGNGAQTDVASLLPGWRRTEVVHLLALSLFDASTPGMVRLHTRELQEYLCARWLDRQTREGILTPNDLCGLLFRPDGNDKVLPDHLFRVAAWLAPRQPRVLDLLLQHAPHQLLDEGDPEALPIEVRERVLDAFVTRFARPDRAVARFSARGLMRFAPGLGSRVRGHLTRVRRKHLRFVLLQLADAGRLAEPAAYALQLALDRKVDIDERFHAIGAAARGGMEPQRSRILILLAKPADLDLDVAGHLVEHLFPKPLDVPTLGKLLRDVAPRGKWNITTWLDRVLLEVVPKKCPDSDRIHLLSAMLEAHHLSQGDEWLFHPMMALLAVHLANQPSTVSDEAVRNILAEFEDQRGFMRSHRAEPLESALRGSADLRLAMTRDFVHRRIATGKPLEVWELANAPIFGRCLRIQDAIALESDGRSRRDEEFQRLGTELRLLLERRASTRSVPPIEAPRRARRVNEDDLVQLRAHVSRIREGHAGLLQHCVHPFSNGDNWGTIDAEEMKKDLGPDLSAAVREGLSQLLRTYAPPPPRERKDSGTPGEVVLTLIALEVEVRLGLDLARLDTDQARRAARAALWELNQFPAWLPQLLAAHRDVVEKEVIDEVLAELWDGDAQERVLDKVFSADAMLRSAVARAVEDALLTTTPQNASLRRAIEFLLSDGIKHPSRWSMALAARVAESMQDQEPLQEWWLLQLHVQPIAALDLLETQAGSAAPTDRARAAGLLARLVNFLERGRNAKPFMTEARALERFYTIVCKHTIVGEERTFSPPNILRDLLRGWIDKSPREAKQMYRRLAKRRAGGFARLREFHLAKAQEAVLRDPNLQPMSRTEAERWVQSRGADPASEQGLFAVALARLSTIATLVRDDKFSYREIFVRTKGKRRTLVAVHERLFQLWLAWELRTRSAGQYNVIREEEDANKKKPDIRLYATASAGLRPTSIEVKVLEKWKSRDIVAALEKQLVGRYMHEVNSQFGILVLCSVANRRSGSRKRDGDRLVKKLRTKAQRIVDSGRARGLKIVMIEFATV